MKFPKHRASPWRALVTAAALCGLATVPRAHSQPAGAALNPLACAGADDDAPVPVKPSPPSLAARSRLNPPARPKTGEPINDLALLNYLEREGRHLVEGGATLTNWPDMKDGKALLQTSPTPPKRARTAVELAARLEEAVVVVGVFYECTNCTRVHLATATGFFLNAEGAVATCRHVLAGNDQKGRGVVVLTRDGQVLPVLKILASDTLNDLLVMQVPGNRHPWLALSDAAPAGSWVALMSHPERHFYMLTTGTVARRSVERRAAGNFERLSITAEFAKGSSGAPVCDAAGRVVGLANSTHSIYYHLEKGIQQDFQMPIRDCTPAGALLRLVGK